MKRHPPIQPHEGMGNMLHTSIPRRLYSLIATLLLVMTTGLAARADTIAYNVNAGVVGNQTLSAEGIGMDFNVGSSAIEITRLGIFDSGGDGLSNSLVVH